MAPWRILCWIVLGFMLSRSPSFAAQQKAGSLRGVVYDKDFGTPLAGAQVLIVETGQKVSTSDQGNFVFSQVPPGKYTLIFTKEGYLRQVKADVIVSAGQLTDLEASLAGEVTEMKEFLVQDVMQSGGASEASLLKLRYESPSLMDSIGADLMSRAGASDAAGALRLVSGASVQDGKFAVIRGLPDRYVSSQMNSVVLPTADENKRAVELDQFPAPVIESIQVSKTFTPDQQGDASGGAVNVRLRGIPDQPIFQIKNQLIYNTQVTGRSDFLTYQGGGVDFWARDGGGRDIQSDNVGSNWDGAAGTTRGTAPLDSKWALTAGDRWESESGVRTGGLVSLFYETKHTFFDDGKDDAYWVTHPGDPMTPQFFQGTPDQGDFKTALYDVTQGTESVKLGALAAFGVETERNSVNLTGLYTRSAEDTATLATDTRGKAYYFPGYNPNDPYGPGNDPDHLHAAPYLRLETLQYTERTTGTLQLTGKHTLDVSEFDVGDNLRCSAPVIDWTLAYSTAGLNQPDKRQFGALWLPASYHAGTPFSDPYTSPETWLPYKPAENFSLGNFQRIWKEIDEQSGEYGVNFKVPFQDGNANEGYLKTGLFGNRVDRKFNQQTFSNFGDSAASFEGSWDDPWSLSFPFEDHPITGASTDVDYKGRLDVSAVYGMLDYPISTTLSVVGGARVESTKIDVVNFPEADATWFPPGATAPVTLNPGDADVAFQESDVLPSLGLVYEPTKQFTVRASYSQTVARQTFKELTPIIQQEYLGGPIFIGNPDLQMSKLTNYDLRFDYVPYEGSLVSTSWFRKDIKDPIEYVQRFVTFGFTTAENYSKGELDGYELEVRQDLGHLWRRMEGFAVGANATFINSQVTLPSDEAAQFNDPGIQAPMTTRDMTNAPDHLYNLYGTYDVPRTGTQFAVFYTVQGDTLVEGATTNLGNFIPSIYAKQYDTLNMSISQALGKYVKLQLQAKNLTNPKIQEVYRSPYIGSDVTKSSYTRGIEYSLGITVSVGF